MLIFPEIDEKQTLSNVKSFFKNDFKKIERLSGYDGVISSPSFDGLHTGDQTGAAWLWTIPDVSI